ncbi:hypothetical protein [Leptospira jelokensis]|uniref:Uncharacterized protein n=1 Tax=Leptospira jelokensis TaxID=2484931 RepID=A0A4Z1A3Z3_9LEPT|nr:hypothetical protein [Leptospira jelokensis]TGL75497.1 hypothetical protein EHQ62_01275 [Leptospira jelokensis]TGM04919.1 hypothetical protein EHQ79_02565 [Leptospira jelokensis]
MNKTIFALSFTLLSVALFAQETGNTQGTQVSAASSKDNRDLYPLSMYDARIRLKNVSFIRRHADTGKGEFLDVQVELESRVPDNHEYSIFVLAGFEGDRVNKDERRLVPYPAWRKADPEKDERTLYFSNIMPTPFTAKEIWGEETYAKKKEEMEKRHYAGFEAEMPEPTFTEVVDYLCKNNAKALPFTLFGETGPSKEKQVIYNYVAQTEDEKKRQVHETLPKHTYTIYNNKYKTTITSHHYTQYRPNFLSFNKVAVLVFDTKKPTNSLLFRKFIDISDLKITY